MKEIKTFLQASASGMMTEKEIDEFLEKLQDFILTYSGNADLVIEQLGKITELPHFDKVRKLLGMEFGNFMLCVRKEVKACKTD